LSWEVEVRFKHLGSESYLYVDVDHPEKGQEPHMYMGLTKDIRNDNTLFLLLPVDKSKWHDGCFI
jgi:hypothetical protein